MRCKLLGAAAAAVLCPLALTAAASADTTLGITSRPSGASPAGCSSGAAFGQYRQDPSTPYFVPLPGGTITSWSHVIGTPDTGGTSLEFIVLRPVGTAYIVVGTDTEMLPATLPPVDSVVSFALATPIAVQPGDTLALDAGSTADCYFAAGATPSGDEITALGFSSTPPTTGETTTFNSPAPFTSVIDVGATFVSTREDAAVTTAAGPSGASAGQAAVLSSTVTNNGPGSGPITFTDKVPAGLTIDSAVAGGGTCSVSAPTVTCTINGLAAGQSAPVDVVVTPSSPGSYANPVAVAVASGVTDTNSANNTASATLNVGLSLPAKCVVPSLKGVASGTAKTVLSDLGCKVKTSKSHSKSVHKGSVVKTKPGAGTYAYQQTITLVVSSGPKKK